MPVDEGIGLLLFAKEKEEEALIFRRWVVQSQFEMSFDEFKSRLTVKPVKSDEEILQDVENILKDWEAQNGIV